MKITRVWNMPNKHTFLIKPIKRLIEQYYDEDLLSIDPFAGFHSPATITNDLNPGAPTTEHMDALEFLGKYQGANTEPIYYTGFYDPPFSKRQASECYKSYGLEHLTGKVTNEAYWSSCKDFLGLLIRPNGHVISCGWNSGGLGISRGFEVVEILLVPHGGGHHDTIVTVEQKLQTQFNWDDKVEVGNWFAYRG